MQGCGLKNSFSHSGLAIRLAYVFVLVFVDEIVFVSMDIFVFVFVFVCVNCRIPTHICLVG